MQFKYVFQNQLRKTKKTFLRWSSDWRKLYIVQFNINSNHVASPSRKSREQSVTSKQRIVNHFGSFDAWEEHNPNRNPPIGVFSSSLTALRLIQPPWRRGGAAARTDFTAIGKMKIRFLDRPHFINTELNISSEFQHLTNVKILYCLNWYDC